MKPAWKEREYNRKKYVLVEIIVILMRFMFLFLSRLNANRKNEVESEYGKKAAVMVTHDESVLNPVDSAYRMEDGKLKKEGK